MTVSAITSSRVQQAIHYAARATGIDFDYLMGQARLESGLDPSARAGTSSASGLYQFLDQSWLAVVKKHGPAHGLGWAADAIQRSASGRLSVGDVGTRQAILALRNDPAVASLMAAEHASDNKDALEATTGREATGTDLYMAHFLGLGGARKFLTRMAAEPDAPGAALFPAAAAANRGVFFSASGVPRSLSAIYERFGARLGIGAEAGAPALPALPAASFAAQALDTADGTVVTGNGESASDALAWARAATGRGQAASLLRPTPQTARLAYLMLAQMGN